MIAFLLTTLLTTWSPELTVEQYIKANYPWPEVKVKTVYAMEKMPEMPPTEIHILKGLPGTTTFLFTFPNDQKVKYIALVDAFDWVLSSRGSIKRGQVISEGDFYETLANVRSTPKGAVSDPDEIIGKIARHSIGTNSIITARSIEEPIVIEKGQLVDIIYQSKYLRISTRGKAKQSGAVGDTIRVVNQSSKKSVSAVIIDGGTVSVKLP